MDATDFFELLFRIYIVLLALLAVSFVLQRPSSDARQITLLAGVVVVVPLVLLVVLIRLGWEPF